MLKKGNAFNNIYIVNTTWHTFGFVAGLNDLTFMPPFVVTSAK